MARKFLTPIDLSGFDLQNARAHAVASDPTGLSTGDAGRLWFNTGTSRLKYWNGSAAELKATDSDLLAGLASSYYLNRQNQTGTITSSVISDLGTTITGYRLNQFTAPNAAVSFGSQRLTTLADPTGAQDGATKNYVDTALSSLTSGQVIKGSVKVASTSNISISSAPATIDGIAHSSGDYVLLAGQTDGTQNGPYLYNGSGSALTRANNWDTNAEAVLGSYWVVREGTQADTFAVLTNDTAIVLGTSTPGFVFRGQAGATYTNGNGLSLSGTTFSVNPASGGGIAVAAGGVSVDGTVGRKVKGLIPAATSGIVTVSGASVTINHALNNDAPMMEIRYYTSPGSGAVRGQPAEVEEVASDANNIAITLPSAPAANQFAYSIIG